MKYQSVKSFCIALSVVAGLSFSACKDKAKDKTDTTIEKQSDTPAVSTPEVSQDATLEAGLRDATKDYPGVTATVKDGEVTLTGTIEKDKVSTLLQSVNGLNPKKVNNQLTYK